MGSIDYLSIGMVTHIHKHIYTYFAGKANYYKNIEFIVASLNRLIKKLYEKLKIHVWFFELRYTKK